MKHFIITLFFLSLSWIGNAQSLQDFFERDDIKTTWYGIDFSHVKLISVDDKSVAEIRAQFFPAWNNLILAEASKYDIQGMLRLAEMPSDLQMIGDLNKTTSLKSLEAYHTPVYSKEDIEKFVAAYTFKDTDGFAVLFVAEALNKLEKKGVFHFVLINKATKEVLLQERMEGAPAGFGLRNYWAGSLYQIIKQIKKKEYKNWKAAL